MFIEKEDLYTAICEYQLQNITTSAVTIRMAILAAIDEARSYLNAKYDCEAIFSATGEDRHATLLEHCKKTERSASLPGWVAAASSATASMTKHRLNTL